MRARRAWSTSAGGLGASGGAVCAKHAAATSTAIAIRNLIPLLYERVSCTVLEPRHLTIGCSRSVLHPFKFFSPCEDFRSGCSREEFVDGYLMSQQQGIENRPTVRADVVAV